MSFKVEYASQRREVWDFYWRAWQRRLWKYHAALFLAVTAAAMAGSYMSAHGALRPKSFLLALGFGLLSIIWLPAYPMLRFKPQVRTLELDQEGVATTIGKRTGQRAWKDVESVTEENGQIVILGRNGNAFLVPARAFASAEARRAFLSFARSALAAASSHIR